jgi:hypothetical protein
MGRGGGLGRTVKLALVSGGVGGAVSAGIAAILFPVAGVPFLLTVGGGAVASAAGGAAGEVAKWLAGG